MSREEAAEWAKARGMIFVETSAKTTEGVSQVFSEVVQQVMDQCVACSAVAQGCCVLLPVSDCSAKTQTVTFYHSCRFLRNQIYCPTHGLMQPEEVELYWMRLILRRRGAVAASSDLLHYITRTFLAIAVAVLGHSALLSIKMGAS